MRIRLAREEDWKVCAELDIAYETESAWQMQELRGDREWGVRFREVRLPRPQRIPSASSPDEWLKAWERADGFWVAVEHRKIVGYVAVILEPEHYQGRFLALAVTTEKRRQGMGTALLEHANAWCLRQGMQQVILECSLKAQPAISFALKHRFAFCGYQDAYWPGQEGAIFFRKRIR